MLKCDIGYYTDPQMIYFKIAQKEFLYFTMIVQEIN